MMLYDVCTIFCENIFNGFNVTEQDMIFILKIINQHNSVKNVAELMFLVSAHCLVMLRI